MAKKTFNPSRDQAREPRSFLRGHNRLQRAFQRQRDRADGQGRPASPQVRNEGPGDASLDIRHLNGG